jgi:hydroxymethylglutaryl-CoA reductase
VSDENTKKFYQLTISERLERLGQDAHLDDETLAMLSEGISLDIADRMIENVVGIQGLPLGVAQHFIVNGREVLVPMAIEEPSVVAGASFMAKLARSNGGFRASSSAPEMIGQLQVLDVKDPHQAVKKLQEHKKELLEEARGVNTFMVNIGGGPRDVEVRLIHDSPIGTFIVLHLIYDVRDAMGANTVNSVMEHLGPIVEDLTGGRAHLAILSNLADRRLTRSSVTIPTDTLAFDDFSGEEVRDGVIEAWAFAVADPYRAATHNKGIMNGVDAVAIATGNDWRGIEAGAHAYAARSGGYTSLSTWEKDSQGNLHGVLEMPMAVGIVGGATQANPVAKACLALMGVQTGNELSEIIVSVGLAQNLAALRALATEGIQRGHMKLHARKTDRTK